MSIASKAKFMDQSLITFAENREHSSCNNDFPNINYISGLVIYDRNFEGQIYVNQDLGTSGHCTVLKEHIPNFLELKFNNKSIPKVPFLHVPSVSNYTSPDSKLIVINSDNEDLSFLEQKENRRPPIATTTNMMVEMFENFLSESFSFDNKKRSTSKSKAGRGASILRSPIPETRKKTTRGKRGRNSAKKRKIAFAKEPIASSSRKKHVLASNYERTSGKEVYIDANSLPVVSLGWTMMDCNQYGNNACTIAGNVKPFLRDGNLPKKVRKILVGLIEFVLEILPVSSTFNLDTSGSERVVQLRTEMIADFKELLCGNRNVRNFRVEGITIVIPLSIGYHKDTLNCLTKGMTSVISINGRIPLNKKTIPSGERSKLWLWLKENGYTDCFPCSIILYSRKCVHSYCEKIAASEVFAEHDLVRKCVKWAMIDRVGTIVDYRSRVWNSPIFPNQFLKYATKKTGSRFKGKVWSSPAAYDKTVSACMIRIRFFFDAQTHTLHELPKTVPLLYGGSCFY